MTSFADDPDLYRLMVDRVQDYAIFLLDPAGNIQSWNAGARRIKQYHAQEVIGRHFSIFYTEPDKSRDWPAQELTRAALEGRFEDEGWRVRRDGSRFWANVVITALRGEDGRLLAYSKITRDISDRKRHEEEMRQSEERFRLLIEGVQDYAIFLVNPLGHVTSWNIGASRIQGYAAHEILGKHISCFFTPEDIEAGKPWAELAQAREHGRAEEEGWRVRKDGSRFWARVVVSALYDTEGHLYGFAKVTQDMTQRRHSESLEISASRVNDFIAVLAHELRNPLAPIRSAAQLLERLPPGDPGLERARQIILRQSGQLNRIVDDLLDVNRIARGTLVIESRIIDCAEFIGRAVETSRPQIDAGMHRLTVDVPAAPLPVNGDEFRLTQVLTNLLNNAARYTPAGGEIAIRARASEDGRQALISVSDSGRGIAQDMLGAIFGMFVQAKDPLARPSSGLGVGLALARAIVELHHGNLTVRSEGEGQGAEFTVCLPLAQKSAVVAAERDLLREVSLPAPAQSAPPPALELQGLRLLVVDDNFDAALSLTALLRTHGGETQMAVTGPDALRISESFRPDVILLDVGMPGMNGLEAARRIRARNREPRPLIIAVTGWGTAQDRELTRDAEFDAHLVKPVSEQQVIDAVRALRAEAA